MNCQTSVNHQFLRGNAGVSTHLHGVHAGFFTAQVQDYVFGTNGRGTQRLRLHMATQGVHYRELGAAF